MTQLSRIASTRVCLLAGAAFLVTTSLITGAATAQDATAEVENSVVAIINGEEITQFDLQLAAQDLRSTLAQVPPEEQFLALVNDIINIRLMARAAEKEGLAEDEGAARRLQFVRDRALRAEYLRTHVFDAITDEAVQAKYDAEIAAFVPYEVKASHILVEDEQTARDIIAELDAGGDFAAIAREKSIDVGSGANGGDLGFFAKKSMVQPFAEAAFALEAGTYTKEPVQSKFGYHIILAVDRRDATPPTLAQRTNALREEVARDMFIAEIDKLRQDAKIELIPPPGSESEDEAPADAPAEDAQ